MNSKGRTDSDDGRNREGTGGEVDGGHAGHAGHGGHRSTLEGTHRRVGSHRTGRAAIGFLAACVALGPLVEGPAYAHRLFAAQAHAANAPMQGAYAAYAAYAALSDLKPAPRSGDDPLGTTGAPAPPAPSCTPSAPSPEALEVHDLLSGMDLESELLELLADGELVGVDLNAVTPPTATGELCADATTLLKTPAAVTIGATTGVPAAQLVAFDPNQPPVGITSIDYFACTPPAPLDFGGVTADGLCSAAAIVGINGTKGTAYAVAAWIQMIDSTGAPLEVVIPVVDVSAWQAIAQEESPPLLGDFDLFEPVIPAQSVWESLRENARLQNGPAAPPAGGLPPPGPGCLILKWECPNGGWAWAYADPDCCIASGGGPACIFGTTARIDNAKKTKANAELAIKLKIAAILVGLLVAVASCLAKAVTKAFTKKLKGALDEGYIDTGFIREMLQGYNADPVAFGALMLGILLEVVVRGLGGPVAMLVTGACVAAAVASVGSLILQQLLELDRVRLLYQRDIQLIMAAECNVVAPATPLPPLPLAGCDPLTP